MKNNEKLLYTIGEVDENAVPEAPEKRKGAGWIKWAAMGSGLCAAAAVLAVVLMGGSAPPPFVNSVSDITTSGPEQSLPENTEDTDVTTSEPEVTNKIDWAEVSIYPEFDWGRDDSELEPVTPQVRHGGMGFEGITVNDQSELIKRHEPNPWSEDMEFETLPVFYNLISDNFLCEGGIFIYLSEKEMTDIAENVAYVLGTEITSADTQYGSYVEYSGDYPTQEQFETAPSLPMMVMAQCADGTEIWVEGNGTIKVEFGTAVALPSGAAFTTADDDSSEKAKEFILERFADLMQFENPTFRAEENVSEYNVYDADDDPVRNLLNYYMRQVDFCEDESGKAVRLIWISNSYCGAEYIGDYPIITIDKAQEMLLEGKYLTTVPDGYLNNGVITAEDIAYSELVYRCSHGHDKYFMPYYRFYVEVDTGEWFAEEHPGMTEYGAFYVPAVSEEYLSDLTVWNGSFN